MTEINGGGIFEDLAVNAPDIIRENRSLYDVIVVTSAPGMDSIVNQLLDYGVEYSNIDVSYVIQQLESRRIFLKQLAELANETMEYAVAEAGVFQGDFAKFINEYFPNRKFYMFDTFEGFVKNDISIEIEKNYSTAKVSDYSNTSVELVLGKMKKPEMCIIKKGFFPQTTDGIKENFFFANLDLDLYQPTLLGLKWFEKQMLAGGIILVHDYFAENFTGVRQAVDDYLAQTKKEHLRMLPIGDGVSVAIVGY